MIQKKRIKLNIALGKANGEPPVNLVLVGSIPTPKFCTLKFRGWGTLK